VHLFGILTAFNPAFHERNYGSPSLNQRLCVSGMRVENRLILSEWLSLDPWIATNYLPRLLGAAFLPVEPLFAAVNDWARLYDQKGRPWPPYLFFENMVSKWRAEPVFEA
jgi:hypothetical protein